MFHRTNLDEDPRKKETRPVILHFHTYKNAGSTVDKILEKSFPGAWANFDGPVPEFFIPHTEIAILARNRAQLKAISSHQIRLPIPEIPGVKFLPIVFVRRPELRAASMWRFERRRRDKHPRTLLAKKQSLKEWIEAALSTNFRHAICNNQAWMFSFRYDQRTLRRDPNIYEYAEKNLNALPLAGIVERFDQSMKLYADIYSALIPEFRFHPNSTVNVTGDPTKSAENQIEELRQQIGDNLLGQLQSANQDDIRLYNLAEQNFNHPKSL